MFIDNNFNIKGQVIDSNVDTIEFKEKRLRSCLKSNKTIHVNFEKFSEVRLFNSDNFSREVRETKSYTEMTKTRCDEDHTDEIGDFSVKKYQKNSKKQSNPIHSIIDKVFMDRDFKNSLGFKEKPRHAFKELWKNDSESRSDQNIMNVIRSQSFQWSLNDDEESLCAFKDTLKNGYPDEKLDPLEIESPAITKLTLDLVSNEFEKDLGKADSAVNKSIKKILAIQGLRNIIRLNGSYTNSHLLLLHKLFPNGREFHLTASGSNRGNILNQKEEEIVDQLYNKEHDLRSLLKKQDEYLNNLSGDVAILDELKEERSLKETASFINQSNDLVQSFKNYHRGINILFSNKEFQAAIAGQ